MKYIEKCRTPFAREGVQESLRILNQYWVGDHYNNLVYDVGDMSRMRDILFKEQKDSKTDKSYCCYCMRELFNVDIPHHYRNITLEHIIPNKIKETDWVKDHGKYQKYTNLDSNHVEVQLNGTLNNIANRITRLPLPHFISYHNLVASCNGKMLNSDSIRQNHCCNTYRGQGYIEPMYLIADISSKIGYDKRGKLDFDDDEFPKEYFGRDGLNLECDGLILFRRFWYKVSQSDYTVEDVRAAEDDKELRYNILDDINEISLGKDYKHWACFYDNANLWYLLYEYNWFYDYYSSLIE